MKPIPPYGLTLQAPWGALIAWGRKDIENRGKGVATVIGDYRGRIALTASKGHTIGDRSRSMRLRHGGPPIDVQLHIQETLRALDSSLAPLWTKEPPPGWADLQRMAGTWFATARVADVLPPRPATQGWHAAGQYGIVLRDLKVLEEFEPATGGQGFFGFSRCTACARPIAHGSRHSCEVQT